MSYFDFGTETTGNFESNASNDFKPIPKNTVVKVIAEEAKWGCFEPNPEHIEIKWSITEGEYKNRKIFQKLRVNDSDEEKARKAVLMLGAIDHNCGGKLKTLTGKPTDSDLTSSLAFKPMFLKLDVWKIDKDDQGNKLYGDDVKQGNWVSSVSSQAVVTQTKEVVTAKEEDDLPF